MSALPKTAAVSPISRARARRDIERAAELIALIKPLTEELDAIKAAFKALGDGEYKGANHKIVVVTSPRTSLDMTEVKARLAPADYIECVVVNDVTRVLVKGV